LQPSNYTNGLNRLQAAEMILLKGTIGISRKDRPRNMEVKERIESTPLQEILLKIRLELFSHFI
jgi:hypothetical protein